MSDIESLKELLKLFAKVTDSKVVDNGDKFDFIPSLSIRSNFNLREKNIFTFMKEEKGCINFSYSSNIYESIVKYLSKKCRFGRYRSINNSMNYKGEALLVTYLYEIKSGSQSKMFFNRAIYIGNRWTDYESNADLEPFNFSPKTNEINLQLLKDYINQKYSDEFKSLKDYADECCEKECWNIRRTNRPVSSIESMIKTEKEKWVVENTLDIINISWVMFV